tara:strand:+ start:41 stop:298 length:258 start_codon:yes stop_codon:yes gene_type:complete
MITDISDWTLFGKEDILEKNKLISLLEITPLTIELTQSTHLSYDLTRLISWFRNNQYYFIVDSSSVIGNKNCKLYFKVGKFMEEE